MKSSFDHPEKSPGYILWKLTTDWQKRLRKALTSLKLTHAQFVYLACLKWLSEHHDEAITQIKLAELSGLDKMVISETSQKLLNKKLVSRKDHSSDSRCYIISLTKKGHQIVDEALPIVEEIDKLFFIEQHASFQSLSKIASAIKANVNSR